MGLKSAWLTKCLKEVHKLKPPFKCAPPRQCLKMFGGSMTIAQFRKNSKFCQWTVSMPPFDPQVCAVYGTVKPITSARKGKLKADKQESTITSVGSSFSPISTTTAADAGGGLKLKRKRIDSRKTNILESMQISRKNAV